MLGSYEGAMVDAAVETATAPPTLAELLMASVQASYDAHRRGRPVTAHDVEYMAERMCDSRHDRTVRALSGDVDSPEYEWAVRAHERRRKALRRLAYALERQAGGERR